MPGFLIEGQPKINTKTRKDDFSNYKIDIHGESYRPLLHIADMSKLTFKIKSFKL